MNDCSLVQWYVWSQMITIDLMRGQRMTCKVFFTTVQPKYIDQGNSWWFSWGRASFIYDSFVTNLLPPLFLPSHSPQLYELACFHSVPFGEVLRHLKDVTSKNRFCCNARHSIKMHAWHKLLPFMIIQREIIVKEKSQIQLFFVS